MEKKGGAGRKKFLERDGERGEMTRLCAHSNGYLRSFYEDKISLDINLVVSERHT